MGKKVLILLDKINSPKCGLSVISEQFIRNLKKYVIDGNIDFCYLIKGKNNFSYLNNGNVYKLKNYNRFISSDVGYIHLAHYLHQLPSFKVKNCDKIILTIHDLNFVFTKSKQKQTKYLNKIQKMINKANAIVFVSNFTKEICYKYLDINSNIITDVIYNGVEISDYNAKKPNYINNNEQFLFSIGQFLENKNYHVLLPFLKLLPENIKLIIAGNCNTRYGRFLKKEISRNNLDKRIILPGIISEEEKKYLYQNCLALLFPSIAEGFGLPVIEAMLYGKPVFCNNATSLPEIGNNFVYFWESLQPESMVKLFNFGLTDYNSEKAQQAFNYAQQFTWQKNIESYYRLYKRLLDG